MSLILTRPIDALEEVEELHDGCFLPVCQNGTARKVSIGRLKESAGGAGHLEVTADGSVASHSASEINAHVENGGTVVLNYFPASNGGAYAQLWHRSPLVVMFETHNVHTDSVTLFAIADDKTCGEETFTFATEGGESTGKPISGFKITEGENGAFSMDIKFTDGTSDTFVVPAGERPAQVTYNGVAIPIEWAVSE